MDIVIFYSEVPFGDGSVTLGELLGCLWEIIWAEEHRLPKDTGYYD